MFEYIYIFDNKFKISNRCNDSNDDFNYDNDMCIT